MPCTHTIFLERCSKAAVQHSPKELKKVSLKRCKNFRNTGEKKKKILLNKCLSLEVAKRPELTN